VDYSVNYSQQWSAEGLRADALLCACGVSAAVWYLLFVTLDRVLSITGLLGGLVRIVF